MTDYTYNTGNPIGSTDVRDGVDNLKSFDVLLNSTDDTYQDRMGNTVPTAKGAIKRLGPVVVAWTFTTGGTLNYPNEAALNPADGNYYGWAGAFPKAVAPGTDPTLPGSGYVPRTDAALRAGLLAGPCATRDGEIALSSIVSIVDFDGVDDFNGTTGTNNKSAFANAITYLNSIGGGDLVLPRRGTGIYWINGDDPTQVTAGIRLVPAEGVSLRLVYSGGAANSPLVNTSLKSSRQLLIYFANFGFTSYVGANVQRELGGTLPTVNNGDGVFSSPTSLSGGGFAVIALSDPSTPITPTAATSDTVSFAGAGVARCAIRQVVPGEEYFALMSSPSAGIFFAGVITAKGYAYVAQDSGTQDVKIVDGTIGLPVVIQGIPYSHTMNQQRDNFNNALVSVKVTSARSFSVLVNGLVVYSYTTRSSILSVAFGSENINDTVAVSQMSIVRGAKSFGGSKPLRIVMCGDSITDNSVQYSHAKYLQMMLGSAGISVAAINNIAVAGQMAAQQYANLQTIVAGYDVCCIQVGVNDIQGATDFSAFSTTIQNMIAYCKSVGMQPIVAIPTAFYSQAEAIANGQPGGQNTSNNASMHIYRALLIRAVAAAGGLLNLETMKAYGAMTAKWLSVAPYSVSDHIVADNIHPTPYGSMMIAQGWARSIIGWLIRPDSTQSEAFEPIPTNWLSDGFGLTEKPTIRGREFKGMLSLHDTLVSDGAVAFTLPPAFKVPTVTIKPVPALNASGLPVGVCSMYVGADGKVYFFALPANTTRVQLDGVII